MESPEVRRRTMQAVKSKNTTPELLVRSVAHKLGFRFRLHRKDLPGKPDLIFPAFHKAIFVHGCFWHGHDCARGARVPKENRGYWVTKIGKNRQRDLAAQEKLRDLGWKTIVFWECELRHRERLQRRLLRFLGRSL